MIVTTNGANVQVTLSLAEAEAIIKPDLILLMTLKKRLIETVAQIKQAGQVGRHV